MNIVLIGYLISSLAVAFITIPNSYQYVKKRCLLALVYVLLVIYLGGMTFVFYSVFSITFRSVEYRRTIEKDKQRSHSKVIQ